ALQPQNRNLLLALAEIYIKGKQFTDAQNVLTQFLAEDQDHLGALMLLSSVHASLGQHTQAIDILQSLITRDDPTPPQRTALAMLLAQSLHAAARTDEARQLILAEFNKRPDDARLLQLLLALTEDEAL